MYIDSSSGLDVTSSGQSIASLRNEFTAGCAVDNPAECALSIYYSMAVTGRGALGSFQFC